MTSMNTATIAQSDLARAIIEDLLSDHPTYDYEVQATGEYYLKPLETLIRVRRQQGKIAAQRTYETLKPLLESLLNAPQQASTSTHNGTQAHQITIKENGMPPLPEDVQLPTCALSDVSPWLDDYIRYSQQLSPEGYRDFHPTCGLWVLSTVAARRVYVQLAEPMHTPLSIALVARTSLFAKTTTARAGIKLLRAANLEWLLGDDETTPQKLLADMAGHVPSNYADMAPEQKEMIQRRMAMSGQLGWFYDEFNQLINAMKRPGPMAEFASLLRKLENCPDTYSYSTRGNGRELIEKPYLALLANTTPANLRKHAGKGDEFWNDGFWARIIFLTPSPHDFVTATMQMGEVSVPDNLSEQLKRWNICLGVPTCTISEVNNEQGKPTGRYSVERSALPSTCIPIDDTAYHAYDNYRITLREMAAFGRMQDLDGSYTRLPQTAIRIAALIASLESIGRITLPVWTVAQEFAEMFRKNLHELYSQVTTYQYEENPLEDTLLGYMQEKGKSITVRNITHYGPSQLRHLKADGVRSLFKELMSSGIVEKDLSPDKKGEWFKLAPQRDTGDESEKK